MNIFEHLDAAEKEMERAVAKLNNYNPNRLSNGKLWVSVIDERKKAVSLLLKIKSLKDRIKRYDV